MLRFDANLSYSDYDRFARTHPFCNLLQSAPWAEVKSSWSARRVGLRQSDGELVAAGQILIRPLPLGLSLWYLPHGPLLDYETANVLESFLAALRDEARQHSCVFLRIHPPLPVREGSLRDFREGSARVTADSAKLLARFASCGFRFRDGGAAMSGSIQPRFQAVVRKQNWPEPPPTRVRYGLKQAAALDLRVLQQGSEALSPFHKLIRLTEERQRIRLRDEAYFRRLMEVYEDQAAIFMTEIDLGKALATAEAAASEAERAVEACGEGRPKKLKQLEEQLLSKRKQMESFRELIPERGSSPLAGPDAVAAPAAMLAIRYGRCADMPYAASDEKYARLPAMIAAYTAGIRWAFDAGCERYNLGGLEGSFEDGLSVFKSHFEPVIEETVGEFDYPARPLLYRIYLALENRRRR